MEEKVRAKEEASQSAKAASTKISAQPGNSV
jgi:hypothetical protein